MLITDQQERVTVRRCAYDRFESDVASRTRSRLNNKLLTETL